MWTFPGVILIMTSNLGSHTMASGGQLGFERLENTEVAEEERRKRNKTNVMVEVERHFRLRFLKTAWTEPSSSGPTHALTWKASSACSSTKCASAWSSTA